MPLQKKGYVSDIPKISGNTVNFRNCCEKAEADARAVSQETCFMQVFFCSFISEGNLKFSNQFSAG